MDKIKASRAFILANGLDAYAPGPFGQAEERFAAAEAAFGKDNAVAKAELDAAAPLYDKTIADGFAKKLGEKRSAVSAARAKADAEKAKVAAKEPYGAAEAAVKQADADATAGKFLEALTGYETAEKGFLDSASLAADRRVRAREALDKAAAALDETEMAIQQIQDDMAVEEGDVQ